MVAVLSAVDFALEKRQNEKINAQSSSLRHVFKCRPRNGLLIFCQILGRFRQLVGLLIFDPGSKLSASEIMRRRVRLIHVYLIKYVVSKLEVIVQVR